jgi:hypothetical protein
MLYSIQFFVYNMPGLVAHYNNFPLMQFYTDIDAFAFITRLKSKSRRSDTTAPYFVINNPQLLPFYVREVHMYTDMDTDSDSDGIFSIYDNLDELRKCVIDNNTSLETGFSEALAKL